MFCPRTHPSSHNVTGVLIHWGRNKMVLFSQAVFSSNVPKIHFKGNNLTAWHQTGDTPSSEPMMAHLCVTLPQYIITDLYCAEGTLWTDGYSAGPRFNIKMSSYQDRRSHFGGMCLFLFISLAQAMFNHRWQCAVTCVTNKYQKHCLNCFRMSKLGLIHIVGRP